MLVLNALLPAVIFQGLLAVKLSREALLFPLVNAAHILAHYAFARLVGHVVLPGGAERAGARATLAFLSSSFAPGLSAFVFIREFAPSGMAMGALMDLASKAYLLGLLPALTQSAYGGAAPPKPTGGGSRLGALRRELAEPLNVAIVGGLTMSALGLGLADLGFLGEAIARLEAAQSPVLFVLIGMTVSLDGDAPVVCGATTLARAALAQACAHGAVRGLGLHGEAALTLVIMFQSACSVVGFAQLEKAAAALSATGVDGDRACALPLALDLIGYSFPLSIALNASAGLLRDRYLDALPLLAPALLVAAVGVALAGRRWGGCGGAPARAKHAGKRA
jgi:hypothetical protein